MSNSPATRPGASAWENFLATLHAAATNAPAATALWVTFMVATPIADYLTNGQLFPWLATAGVALQFLAVLALLWPAWGPRRLGRSLAVAAALAWLAEAIGVATGWPFGRYHYTAALQPQLAGVPWLIPLAWLMMLPPSWAVASAVVSPARRALFAPVAALAFTAWDLFLDPQMVARGLWIWAAPGGYFGIPWQNFFGWWLTATLVTLLCAPRALPARPLAVIYTLTWFLQVIGLGIFWGQPGPALAGGLAMGIWVAWFWRRPPSGP